MRRLISALVIATALGSAVAAPAEAAPVKKPKLGLYTCAAPGTDGSVPMATLELYKGNKYAANGDTEKGKYVYKAGQKTLKFKSGIWKDYFKGTYDKDAQTITLVNLADDSTAGVCTQPAV